MRIVRSATRVFCGAIATITWLVWAASPVSAGPPPSFASFVPITPDDAIKPEPYNFDVSPTGAALWQMALNLPEGRNGMKPALSLAYSSKGGASVLGLGFSLSGLSAITRCWTTPAQDGVYRPDRTAQAGVADAFCLNGQRIVPRPGGDFTLEFDPGTLIRMSPAPSTNPASFVVISKDGQIARYGWRDSDSNSKVHGPTIAITVSRASTPGQPITSDLTTEALTAPDRTVTWNIDRLEDRYSNYVDFNYDRTLNPSLANPVEVVISEIKWTGNSGQSLLPQRSVSFQYDTRLDSRRGFVSGLPVLSAKRLIKIVVKAPSGLTSSPTSIPQTVREYRFDYFIPGTRARIIDRLQTITECVPNDATSTNFQCLDPVSFTWSGLTTPATPQFELATSANSPIPDMPTQNPVVSPEPYDCFDAAVGDVNGDGLDDVLYRVYDPQSAPIQPGDAYVGKWRLRLGTPTGLAAPIVITSLPHTLGGDFKFSARLVDIDSDGQSEAILYSEPLPIQPQTSSGYVVYHFNKLTSQFDVVQGAGEPTNEPFLNNFPRRAISLVVGDLDGDGRVDTLKDGTLTGAPLTPSSLPNDPASLVIRQGARTAALSFGTPFALNTTLPTSASGPVSARVGEDRYIVDIDGNGAPELLVPTYQASPPWFNRAATFTAVTAPFMGTGNATLTETTLPALPAEFSDLVASFTGASCETTGNLTRFSRWFLDLNGDGLPDSIAVSSALQDQCTHSRPIASRFFVSTNAGVAFRPTQQIILPSWSGPNPTMLANHAVDSGLRIVDLDRDGREDLLLVSNSTVGVFGNGPGRGPGAPHQNMVWLRSTGIDGQGAFDAQELNVPLDGGYQDAIGGRHAGYGPRMTQLADVNGDGLVDIVTFVGFNIGVYLQKPVQPDVITAISGGPHMPAISATYALGSVATPNGPYQLSILCNWPQRCQKSVGWVVSEHRQEVGFDNPGQQLVYQHRYENAVADLLGRGMLGVSRYIRTMLDETGNKYETTIVEFDLTTRQSRAIPASLPQSLSMYAYTQTGIPKKTTTTRYLAATNLIMEKEFKRSLVTAGAGYRIAEETELADQKEDATVLNATRGHRTFDDYGNIVSEKTEAGDTIFSMTGAPTGLNVSSTIERASNLISLSDWLVNRFQTITSTLFDRSIPTQTSLVRSMWLTYLAGTSDLASVTLMPQGPAETTTSSGFTHSISFSRSTQDGSIQSVTESTPPAGTAIPSQSRTTLFNFASGDPEKIFIARVTNPLGHIEQFHLHAGLGLLMAYDDPNNVRTSFIYDALGRPSLITELTTTSGGVASTSYVYKSEKAQTGIAQRLRNINQCATSDTTGFSCETINPLGQVVQTQRDVFNLRSNTIMTYDRFGQRTSESLPFEIGRTPLFVNYTRDNVGRVTVVSRPGETATAPRFISRTSYSGRTITETSERGVLTTDIMDFLGRLSDQTTYEAGGGHSVGVHYDYWHGAAPRRVVHPAVPGMSAFETTIDYDILGRRVALNDPDTGRETSLFNGFDELKQSQDANGGTTSYGLDALGRITLIETPATQAYPSRSGWPYARRDAFTYDGPNGLGLLATATANAALPGQPTRPEAVVTSLSYDGLARPITKTVTESGSPYVFSYSYNSLSQLSTLGYPSVQTPPFVVRYDYARSGEPAAVWNATNSQAETILWKQIGKNAAGESTQEQFGVTADTTRAFDQSYALRLVTTKLRPTNQTIQQLVYHEGADGFISSRGDLNLEIDEQFHHDFLGRLDKWTVTQNCHSWGWAYGYDDRGNLIDRAVSFDVSAPLTWMTLGYSGSHPQAASSVTQGGQTVPLNYDSSGQMITGEGKTYSWTPFGLPLSISTAGTQVSYLYDAFGSRIKKTIGAANSAGATLSLDGLYQLRTSQALPWAQTYSVIGDGGIVVAEIIQRGDEQPETHFFHPDHLGNPDAVTSEVSSDAGVQSALLERGKYDPFGERRYPWAVGQAVRQSHSVDTVNGFTGHEPDDNFDLINMLGRIYDPNLARFISPDPLVDGDDVEALNRYSYVHNSPAILVDPSGYDVAPAACVGTDMDGNAVPCPTASAVASGNDAPAADPHGRNYDRPNGPFDFGTGARAKVFTGTGTGTATPASDEPRRDQPSNSGAEGPSDYSPWDFVGDLLNPSILGRGYEASKLSPEERADMITNAYRHSGYSQTEAQALTQQTLPGFQSAGYQLGGMLAGVLAGPFEAIFSPRSNIVYGGLRGGKPAYIGRAGGPGSPKNVMAGRISKGHDVFKANPDLEPQPLMRFPNKSSAQGGEGALHDYFSNGGTNKLLNSAKSPPLGKSPGRLPKSFKRFDDYSNAVKSGEACFDTGCPAADSILNGVLKRSGFH